jgi:hypothetical protein
MYVKCYLRILSKLLCNSLTFHPNYGYLILGFISYIILLYLILYFLHLILYFLPFFNSLIIILQILSLNLKYHKRRVKRVGIELLGIEDLIEAGIEDLTQELTQELEFNHLYPHLYPQINPQFIFSI